MNLLSSLVILVIITESSNKVRCQCFPIDGRVTVPGSPLSTIFVPSVEDDSGEVVTVLVDGDMLSSVNTFKRSQLDMKRDSLKAVDSSSSSIQHHSLATGKTSVSWRDLLWPEKLIPFDYHGSIDTFKKSLIMKAMEHFESNTCVRFREKEADDEYWVTFRSDSSGCFAFLGRDSSCRGQGQPVSLSRGCNTVLIAAHEIAHVVGLKHQHNRPDRDEFIHINWSNIAKVNQRYFRRDNSTETFGLPYDLTSLMQYNISDVFNRSTMVSLNPLDQRLLGKSSGLSFWDRKQINLMYSCNDSCSNLNKVHCFNDGYLYPSDGKTHLCECQCPPNFTGKRCETQKIKSYYEAVHPFVCGGVIKGGEFPSVSSRKIVLETLGYPGPRNPSISCTWIVEVPNNSVAFLTFESFNLTSRSNGFEPSRGRCRNESLEIRLNNSFEGNFYCGSDITTGQTMIFGEAKQLFLIIQSFDDQSGGSFRAILDIVPAKVTESPEIGTSVMGWVTSKPTSPTTEGRPNESQVEGGENKDLLGFPVDRLVALPFQLIASIVKTLSQTLQRG